MQLSPGAIGCKRFQNPGSFSSDDFGIKGKMVSFYIDNSQGLKDCYLFANQSQGVLVSAGTKSVWFTMPTGLYDAVSHPFFFDTNDNSNGIVVVAIFAL
jgi:hypothetical protein